MTARDGTPPAAAGASAPAPDTGAALAALAGALAPGRCARLVALLGGPGAAATAAEARRVAQLPREERLRALARALAEAQPARLVGGPAHPLLRQLELACGRGSAGDR